MNTKIFAGILLAASVAAAPAFALDVKKTGAETASAAKVWAAVGGFCDIQKWHPAVEKCELSTKNGKPVRLLSLKGGGTVTEQQTARNDKKFTYTYIILDGVLPVQNYKSTISVHKKGKGSEITWVGKFKAKGAPDAKAIDVIGGVYTAGIDGITKAASAN